jgi:hypothetical protein
MPKRARNARLSWLVPPRPQRLTMFVQRPLNRGGAAEKGDAVVKEYLQRRAE